MRPPSSRPTVRDVAKAAGVSLATVDRVLNGRIGVRPATQSKVLAAMEKLSFERDIAAANLSKRREYRITFILPEGENSFMRGLEAGIEALRRSYERERVRLQVLTVPAFDGITLAALLDGLGPDEVDGVAVVATDAPVAGQAISGLMQKGVHVVTIVSDLPSSPREHFVGIDNVVAGRTAAGLLGRFCSGRRGSIAVIAGSMVLRDHVERRLGFDQVMRADYPDFVLLPTIEGADDSEQVELLLSDLLRRHDDIVGIYSLGAGNRGVARAVRKAGLSDRPYIVVHDLTKHARAELQSGLFDAVINQDIGLEIHSAVRVLTSLIDERPIIAERERIRVDIFTRDNLP
ncbi:LacI family DNA-binding transcriptional regulator [Tropicimonas sp. IMCC6043]|uniref:LacI family DNA-binding transcriptional regulator n=1 Tax=Tropicimonas sp. IMCC6043 TaxID=2510645 RepID=UPI00101E0629|nr:LacI family DNA-binding transcriptional regulator [Tropicimonas sp. IMCC6043]RYH11572.1 LacI family DNA-binding transcriptional regulator [Tropicimonas sp. IMCC6043]